MLRSSQNSQKPFTSMSAAPLSRRIDAKAPYEPSRTFARVPNTSNDNSFGVTEASRRLEKSQFGR